VVRAVCFAVILGAPLAAAFELAGAVVDDNGAPVVGAAVWLAQDGRSEQTETDAAGRFRFDALDAGHTAVVARKEGRAIDGFDGPLIGPLSVTLCLRSPGEVPLRVIDATYAPVAGARIKGLIVGGRFYVPLEDLRPLGFPSERSDAEGRLVIRDLPAESHVRFLVGHHQYADTEAPYLLVGGEKQTIVLVPGVPVRGRVTDPAGQGVARVRVALFRADANGRREFAVARTDPEGFYTARARAGDYHVAIRHPQYASPPPAPVTLHEEAAVDVPDLQLLSGQVIRGSVIAPDGHPLGGVPVVYWVGEVVYCETLTQFDGTFRILAPPGDGLIRIVPPAGFMTAESAPIPVKAVADAAITLRPVRLEPLPEITGVVRGKDGQPAPNVLIGSVAAVPPVWTVTDAEGRFRLRLAAMPEEKKVEFRAEHALRFLRRTFKVNTNKPKPVKVTLGAFEPDVGSRPPKPGGNDLTALLGEPAPEIDCDAWFNTPPLTLEALRGQVVVLTFWGGFDERPETHDCLDELRALYALFEDVSDVTFIAVHDGSADPDEVQAYVEQRQIEFPVGRDTPPFRTFERYRVRYIPQTVLIDRHGVLRHDQVDGRLLELIKDLRRKA